MGAGIQTILFLFETEGFDFWVCLFGFIDLRY